MHAGLESAVIGAKIAGLDMISFGPQIESPHSPDERVSIPTVERFWRLLVGVVDELSQAGRYAAMKTLVIVRRHVPSASSCSSASPPRSATGATTAATR